MQVEGHMISSSDAATEYMRQEQILMLRHEEHDASHQESEPDSAFCTSSASEDEAGEDGRTQKSDDESEMGTGQSAASFRDSPTSLDDRTLTLALQKRPLFQGGTDTKCSILEAQQMIHRLAVEMVQKSPEPSNWSWHSSGRRADNDKSESSQSRTSHKRSFRNSVPGQRFDEADDDPGGSENDAKYGERHDVNERLRKLEDLLHRSPSATEKKTPLMFQDAHDRKFSFPWNISCTWKVIIHLLALFLQISFSSVSYWYVEVD